MTTSTKVWILFLVNTNVNLLMGGIHYSWRLLSSHVETNISHNGYKSVMNYIMGLHVLIATSARFHYGFCFIFFHLLFIVWLPWKLQKGRTFWREGQVCGVMGYNIEERKKKTLCGEICWFTYWKQVACVVQIWWRFKKKWQARSPSFFECSCLK